MNSLSGRISAIQFAAAVALTGLAALGCKSHGNTELLERELRCQEDRIYRLEDELDDKCYALEASRRENDVLKKEMAGGDRGPGAGPSTAPPAIEAPTIETPKFEFVPKSQGSETLEDAPRFEDEGLEEAPKFESPTPSSPSADRPGLLLQQATKRTALTGDARHIAKLVLNRQLTGGWNPNGKHGDEGIFVAFEPRDNQNKLVEAVGDVSIVVLDPLQTGAAARVARWDFTTDEAAMHFRKGPLGQGLQFELPWPSSPPVSSDLRLFVRLKTPDGRKVETDTKIRITPNDGWSTKTAEHRPVDYVESEPQAEQPSMPAQSRVVKRKPRPWSPNR
jgi:hypothetical protein